MNYLFSDNIFVYLLSLRYYIQYWPFNGCNSRYCISIEILNPCFNLKHWMFLNIVLKVFMDQMFNFNLMHFDASAPWMTMTRIILFYDNLMFSQCIVFPFHNTFSSFSHSILAGEITNIVGNGGPQWNVLMLSSVYCLLKTSSSKTFCFFSVH